MNHIIRLLAIGITLSALIVGCANDQLNEVSAPQYPSTGSSLSKELPSGAVINEAKLRIYCISSNGMPIVIHPYTQAWDESTVTWSEMNAAIDVLTAPIIFGPYTPTGGSFFEVDVTDEVKKWISSPENFGLLFRQEGNDTNYTYFASSEWVTVAQRPALVITYNDTVTTTVQRGESGEVYDAYGLVYFPDTNFGSLHYFGTGRTPTTKMSLIKFDISVNDDGCTRTIGYWKTHAGDGPQADDVTPLLTPNGIWLGDQGGAKSIHITTAAQAIEYLSQTLYGGASNGITKLYAQLLGAKLNFMSGAGIAPLESILPAVDAFLAQYDGNDWGTLTKQQKNQVLQWQRTIDNYNNGLLGVAHCF
ncbi:MAG TPA: DNRLRE domain-containing protein [Bacteroidota bacterium]|nr:DNRLRE domain-containing protein [Bacteroidota bacterium]